MLRILKKHDYKFSLVQRLHQLEVEELTLMFEDKSGRSCEVFHT